MHDTAEYDKKTHLLDMNDIALNCLLVMEAENTAQICRALGQDGAEYDAFARELGEAVNAQLYDEEREIYANRKLDGSFASVSPTSFYPMTAGIAPENRQNKLLPICLMKRSSLPLPPSRPSAPTIRRQGMISTGGAGCGRLSIS